MKKFKAWRIRNFHKKELVQLKLEMTLQLGDVVHVATDGGQEKRFVYVGRCVYMPLRDKTPKVKVTGPTTIKEFLL